MVQYWWQCKHCDKLLKKESTPSNNGCTSDGHSFHDWRKLARVGDTNYECKHCGLSLEAEGTPSNSGCTANGHSFHDWRKY